MANFTTADRIGGIGGYIGGISTLLGMANGGILGGGGAVACSENMPVNRYEATQSARIAELETEVKLRDANFYTLSEMGKLRDYVDGRLTGIESQICEQKVFNATAISNINCISNQVAQLMGLTKLVVPNTSICPGWGDVTVSITPTTTPTTTG